MMFRVLLIIALIAVGYDAVVHQGAYTRNIWTNLVELTDSVVNSARQLGQSAREENRTQSN